MYTKTSSTHPFKLFQQLGRSIKKTMDPQQMLQVAVDGIGRQFELDRSIALMLDSEAHVMTVKAEYRRDNLRPVGDQKYQLRTNTEWYRLLSQGKPLPMTDIQSEAGPAAVLPELDRFVKDCGSK